MNKDKEFLASEAERTSAYEAELLRRFEAGLPLTRADKREAKRISAERKTNANVP